MNTEVLRVDPVRPEAGAIARAADVLTQGGLVVIPTETVYGLAARADEPTAVAKIFEAKGRPAYNPLIVHVSSLEEARSLASHWPDTAETLARAAWPGPLTLVVPRNPARVPDGITAGGETVALRLPDHPIALAVLRALGRPFAAPSANRFQSVSPTTALHALKSLEGRVPLVLDGGPSAKGIESTVLDCTDETPTLLRPGALSLEKLRALVGELRIRDVRADGGDETLRAPGLLRKHYAPSARLVVARTDALDDALRELGTNVALVTHRENLAPSECARAVTRMPREAEDYAAVLYATLHSLDEAGHDGIVVEAVPEGDGWTAVRDRLARAAG
jgi:L-threonylcarbamoyladenylate synthase